jgi:hypothetical protein
MIKRLLLSLFFVLVFATLSSAATQYITSLPFTPTIHSGDATDTIKLHAGTNHRVSSDSMGIILDGTDNDNWVVDLSGADGIPGNEDDDTLAFGMDNSYYYNQHGIGVAGIYTGYYNTAENFKVRGGYILHMPSDISDSTLYADSGKTAINAVGIFAYYRQENLVLDSIAKIYITGYGESGFNGSSGSYGVYVRGDNILIRDCVIKTRHYGFESRMAFLSSAINYTSNGVAHTLAAEQDYHIRVENCLVDIVGHCGVNLYGTYGDHPNDSLCVAQIEGNIFIQDNHNDDPTTGYTNGWAIHYRGIGSGNGKTSYIRNNVFLAGKTWAGGRGIELREGNCRGNWVFCNETNDTACNCPTGKAVISSAQSTCCPRYYYSGVDTCVNDSACCPWFYYIDNDTCNGGSGDYSCCPGGVPEGCDSAKHDCDSIRYRVEYCDSAITLAFGSRTDTVEVSGNYFYMHQGRDEEYASVWGSTCMKIRRGNFYYYIHDNTFIELLDTNTTLEAQYHPYGTCVTWQIEMDNDDSTRAPYHSNFSNNKLMLLAGRDNTGGAHVWGAPLSVSARPDVVTEVDTTFDVFDNLLYSECGTCLNQGSTWDACLHWFDTKSNLFIHNNDSGHFKSTITLGGGVGNHELSVLDPEYGGGAADSDFGHFVRNVTLPTDASDFWEMYLKRTFEVYVLGSNGQFITDAEVLIINAYTDTVNGTTDVTGKATIIVDYDYYCKYSATGDSVGCGQIDSTFNNFSIQAKKGNDSTTNFSITIGGTIAGGVDTVTLSATAGTVGLTDWDPTIGMIRPFMDLYEDSTDNITVTVADIHQLDSIFCFIHGPDANKDTVSIIDIVGTSYNFSQSYTWYDSGLVWLVIRVKDTAGNEVSDSLRIYIDKDAQAGDVAPSIGAILPTSGYRDSINNITCSITDDHELDSLWCYVREPNNDSTYVFDTGFTTSATVYNLEKAHTWLNSGNSWIVIVAKDSAAVVTKDSIQTEILVRTKAALYLKGL